jgi:DNA-binding response OmpR family regulator
MMCSCCGQPIPENATVIISLDNNTLVVRGQCVKLAPRQAEILFLLVKRMPNIVPYSILIEQVWSSSETESTSNTLKVHISNIRRKVRPLGLNIERAWGHGLRLVDCTTPIKQVAA